MSRRYACVCFRLNCHRSHVAPYELVTYAQLSPRAPEAIIQPPASPPLSFSGVYESPSLLLDGVGLSSSATAQNNPVLGYFAQSLAETASSAASSAPAATASVTSAVRVGVPIDWNAAFQSILELPEVNRMFESAVSILRTLLVDVSVYFRA